MKKNNTIENIDRLLETIKSEKEITKKVINYQEQLKEIKAAEEKDELINQFKKDFLKEIRKNNLTLATVTLKYIKQLELDFVLKYIHSKEPSFEVSLGYELVKMGNHELVNMLINGKMLDLTTPVNLSVNPFEHKTEADLMVSHLVFNLNEAPEKLNITNTLLNNNIITKEMFVRNNVIFELLRNNQLDLFEKVIDENNCTLRAANMYLEKLTNLPEKVNWQKFRKYNFKEKINDKYSYIHKILEKIVEDKELYQDEKSLLSLKETTKLMLEDEVARDTFTSVFTMINYNTKLASEPTQRAKLLINKINATNKKQNKTKEE